MASIINPNALSYWHMHIRRYLIGWLEILMMKTRSSFHSNMTASNGRFCVGIRILYPTVLEFFTTNQVASTKDFFNQSSQNTPLLIAHALKELKDSSWCQMISRSRGNRSSSSADGRKELCQRMGSEWQCLNERQDAATCLTRTPMAIGSCADGVTCGTVDIAEKWPWWDPMQMWRENGGVGNGSNQNRFDNRRPSPPQPTTTPTHKHHSQHNEGRGERW